MWAILAVALVAATPPGGIPALGREVVPDGRVDRAEWKGARELSVHGMRVRLGRRGDVLAVAVELEGPGISSLVVGAGDHAWVLHASAALGTGEYRCAADGACTRTPSSRSPAGTRRARPRPRRAARRSGAPRAGPET